MQLADEPVPAVGGTILCRHPFQDQKRAKVSPSRVEEMQELIFDGSADPLAIRLPTLHESKAHCAAQISSLRADIIRSTNPTPYKVSVSERLFDYLHALWLEEAPIEQLS